MSAFSVWALGVAGIATLGVIVDILLPKGRMHNYVKSMFSLFTVFVIIYPIPGLIKNGFDFSEFFGSEITEDAAYTDVSENYLKNEFERAVEKHLLSEGVEARVTVYGNVTAEGSDINYIYVELLKSVIENEDANINSNEAVAELVAECANIGRERITVYG